MADSFHLNERVVAKVAEAAVSAVPGTVGVDSKLGGLANRALPRVEAYVDHVAGTTSIVVTMAAAYPAPIVAVTDAVRAAVISHVETLTGLTVKSVKITVADTKLTPTPVTADEVAGHPSHLVPRPIAVKQLRVFSPVTRPRAPLRDITVRSSADNVVHPDVPPAPAVRTQGFAPSSPRPLVAVHTEPHIALRPVTLSPTRISAQSGLRPGAGAPPPTQVRPVRTPVPTPVRIPRAPTPRTLRHITINPVVKYYDLHR